jgi:hypothetical protein
MASLLHFSNIPSKGGDSNASSQEKSSGQKTCQEDREEGQEKVNGNKIRRDPSLPIPEKTREHPKMPRVFPCALSF